MIISPKKHEETEGETVEMDDFRSWKSVGLVSLGIIVFHTVEQLRWEVGTHSSPSSSINSIRHLLFEHFFSLSLPPSLFGSG